MAEPPHRRGPPRPPAAQKAGAADRSPPFINLCGDYRFNDNPNIDWGGELEEPSPKFGEVIDLVATQGPRA